MKHRNAVDLIDVSASSSSNVIGTDPILSSPMSCHARGKYIAVEDGELGRRPVEITKSNRDIRLERGRHCPTNHQDVSQWHPYNAIHRDHIETERQSRQRADKEPTEDVEEQYKANSVDGFSFPECVSDEKGGAGSSMRGTHFRSEYEDLLVYHGLEGTRRALSMKEVSTAVRLTKYRLKYRKGVPRVAAYVTSVDQLPKLYHLKEVPSSLAYSCMGEAEQLRWLNALRVTNECLHQEEERESRMDSGKAWPSTMLRSEAEILQNDMKEDQLTLEQREALEDHRGRFDPNGPVGKPKTRDRVNYMRSHHNLRELGIPLREPHSGPAALTLKSFEEKRSRRKAAGGKKLG
ncbi:hypothetical protein CBS101457_003449 [Exobasidium rhododendri]|nr:hypothetical protein CBS101457_003449 [Exobasidium rhododendri]